MIDGCWKYITAVLSYHRNRHLDGTTEYQDDVKRQWGGESEVGPQVRATTLVEYLSKQAIRPPAVRRTSADDGTTTCYIDTLRGEIIWMLS